MFVSCHITSNKTILGLDIINSYLCSYITTVKIVKKKNIMCYGKEMNSLILRQMTIARSILSAVT